MLLHGAILPPRAVLEAVDAVVRSVSVPVPEVRTEQAPAASPGLLGRLGRRKAGVETTPVPAAAPPMLEHVPLDRMHLPVTGFGNLTTGDAYRLADAVADEAAGWAAPTVRLAGGTALEFPGDWSVWARLEGDLDELRAVARGVTECVEHLGLFVDRRIFRPMLSVATVTESTTGAFLESVVAALEGHRGEEWTVEVTLVKETYVAAGQTELAEFRRIPLGG